MSQAIDDDESDFRGRRESGSGMVSAAQIRAARALLDVTQNELARAAGVSLATLNNLERGAADPRTSTLDSITTALQGAGVRFADGADGEGVSLAKLSRPDTHGSVGISQRLLELLEGRSLIKLWSVLLYVRHIRPDEQPPPGLQTHGARFRLCALLQSRTQAVLFDRVDFQMDVGARAAEVGNVLLSAFQSHAERLFTVDHVVDDTSAAEAWQAYHRLNALEWMPLLHPRQVLGRFDDWQAIIEAFEVWPGHPVHELIRLYGR
jgi:transcriptional regulator with XRE-family HTH domain